MERAFTEGYRLIVEPIRFNGNFHLHYYPHIGQRIAENDPQIVHVEYHVAVVGNEAFPPNGRAADLDDLPGDEAARHGDYLDG